MNLPSLYARVVAKRPELAVPNLAYDQTPHWRDTEPRGWCFHGDYSCPEDPAMVAALILARWVEALPVGHHLSHDANEDGDVTWCVYVLQSDGVRFINCPRRVTPIQALAAFYFGDSQ